MTYWEGVVLGLVQGLTEFLPVSSSGHLVLAEAALGLSTPGVVVEVALHFATLLAIVVVYWQSLAQILGGCLRGDRAAWMMVVLLTLGTIPAAVLGLALKDMIERSFDALALVGVHFLVTGAILWSTRMRERVGTAVRPTPGGALAIGVSQALALLPGISRSGATVAAGLWLGVSPVRAAEFSFLLAIPAILGATVLQIPELSEGLHTVGLGPLLASTAAALVTGVFAIRFLVALLRRGTFYRFAPYCWVIGLITISWGLVG